MGLFNNYKQFEETYRMVNPMALLEGYQNVYTFENGYGLSIISNPVSYGGQNGLFEAALLGLDGEIIYREDLGFPDVQGHLDFADIAQLIEEIKNLPPLEKNS